MGHTEYLVKQSVYRLRHRYGLTPEEYDAMVWRQGGRCLSCAEKRRLCIDHDHRTGEVRGLLCYRCNLLIGFIEQPGNRLAKVLQYLEGFRGN